MSGADRLLVILAGLAALVGAALARELTLPGPAPPARPRRRR